MIRTSLWSAYLSCSAYYACLLNRNKHRSQNSVLVNAGAAGEEWQATGGIEEEYCIPGRVPKFSYSGEMKIHSEGASDANVQYEILMDGMFSLSSLKTSDADQGSCPYQPNNCTGSRPNYRHPCKTECCIKILSKGETRTL
jgi:hypothetical protein